MWHDLQLPLLNTHVTYTLPGYCSMQIDPDRAHPPLHIYLHFTLYTLHITRYTRVAQTSTRCTGTLHFLHIM